MTPPSIHSPVVYHVIWPGAARRTFTKTCSPAQVDPGRMLFSYPFIEGLMHWYTNVLLRFIQVQIPSRSLNMIIIIIIITIIYIMITTMIMTKRCRKLALLFVTTIVQGVHSQGSMMTHEFQTCCICFCLNQRVRLG